MRIQDNQINIDSPMEFNFKVAIFDLDFTLWDGVSLYANVLDILNTLRKKGIRMYVVSFHLDAIKCCAQLQIHDFFDGIVQGRDYRKSDIVNNIKHKHQLFGAEEIIFFDDSRINIIDVANCGVTTVHVDSYSGLTWQHIPRKEEKKRILDLNVLVNIID